MSIHMVAIERKSRPFGNFEGSNSNIRSKGKSGDKGNPGKDLGKYPKKDNPSSSAITPS